MPTRPDFVAAASRPPRHLPDQAAASFTTPLRRSGDGVLSPPFERTSASWRALGRDKCVRLVVHRLWAVQTGPADCQASGAEATSVRQSSCRQVRRNRPATLAVPVFARLRA